MAFQYYMAKAEGDLIISLGQQTAENYLIMKKVQTVWMRNWIVKNSLIVIFQNSLSSSYKLMLQRKRFMEGRFRKMNAVAKDSREDDKAFDRYNIDRDT